MFNKVKFTVIFILILVLVIFITPYFYNKFVYAPRHSAQTSP